VRGLSRPRPNTPTGSLSPLITRFSAVRRARRCLTFAALAWMRQYARFIAGPFHNPHGRADVAYLLRPQYPNYMVSQMKSMPARGTGTEMLVREPRWTAWTLKTMACRKMPPAQEYDGMTFGSSSPVKISMKEVEIIKDMAIITDDNIYRAFDCRANAKR
jgi:hypothetical protein